MARSAEPYNFERLRIIAVVGLKFTASLTCLTFLRAFDLSPFHIDMQVRASLRSALLFTAQLRPFLGAAPAPHIFGLALTAPAMAGCANALQAFYAMATLEGEPARLSDPCG